MFKDADSERAGGSAAAGEKPGTAGLSPALLKPLTLQEAAGAVSAQQFRSESKQAMYICFYTLEIKKMGCYWG